MTFRRLVGDGQVALDKGAELGVEEEGAGLAVAEELVLDGKPDRAGGGAGRHHRVGEVVGEGVVDPRPDDAVHPRPIWMTREGTVVKDVGVEGELADHD